MAMLRIGSTGTVARTPSVLAVPRDDTLGQLLAARPRHWIEAFLHREVGERREVDGTAFDARAQVTGPTLVALLPQTCELALGHDVGRREQGARQGVDAADVCDVEIGRVDRLAAQLRIEVEAAGAEALVLEELDESRHELLGVVGKLIGVPAVARIAAVDVDRAEDAVGARRRDLVLEIEARQGRMVDLDVDSYLLGEAVLLQEGEHRRDVPVVLMFGGLEGLGLDEDRPFEADAMLVLDHHREEAAVVIELALEVGIEQGVVALAPAPEHVVLTAQAVSGLEAEAHLRRGPGVDLGIGARGRTAGVTRMAEEVCRTPEELHAGRSHLLLHLLHDRLEVAVVLFQRGRRRHRIDVVEGEVGNAEALEEIESSLELLVGHLLSHLRGEPRAGQGAATEDVLAGPVEGVPVADRASQPFLHALAENLAVLVVDPVGELVRRFRTLVADRIDAGKQSHERNSRNVFLRSRYSRWNVRRRLASSAESAVS